MLLYLSFENMYTHNLARGTHIEQEDMVCTIGLIQPCKCWLCIDKRIV